jgi:phosphopantothenoylcysteine decarboxylase/phosphopantothenate--cysteine ligase
VNGRVDLSSRRILLGLTGGIACYKMASVASALVQRGAEVTVAMTESAARFVAPLTFQALSGRPVYTSPWDHVESHDPQHVDLARRTEVALVAPCSMDMLAQLAGGHAADVVSLIVAAIDRARTPVLLAPSMNAVMWAQPATRRNLAILREDGFDVIEPAVGWQACRTEGAGRLPEPEALVEAVAAALGRRPARSPQT